MGLFGKTVGDNEISLPHPFSQLFQRNIGDGGALRQVFRCVCAATEYFAFHVGYDALPRADIAIEAAFEDMEVKRAIFAKLDAALPETAILATNTSYLDVPTIAAATKRPQDVIGMHFFSPANVMKLLEIVRPKGAADDAINGWHGSRGADRGG